MFCREQAARIAPLETELAARGVRLVAIGNGTAPMARDFQAQFDIRFPLYTDPGRQTYRWMGFKRSLGATLGTLTRAKRALDGGFRQGAVQGDPWQQGGDALIDRGGEVRWSRPSGGPGDHASLDEIRAAVAKLPV
mgnify:CR=1 FL=1